MRASGFSQTTCLPAFRRRDGKLMMLRGWNAEVDEIHPWIGQEVLEFRIGLHLGHVELERFATADVANDTGKVAINRQAHGIADGGHAGAGDVRGKT